MWELKIAGERVVSSREETQIANVRLLRMLFEIVHMYFIRTLVPHVHLHVLCTFEHDVTSNLQERDAN